MELISNAMAVNAFVALWSVRYETLKTVPLVVRQGDWLFSVDLTDAYHQWRMTEKSRRLFGHSLELTQQQMRELEEAGLLPEAYEWDREAEMVAVFLRPVGLPMGFTNACAVFTKISRVYVAKWRREGKRCVHLLDDLMFAVSGSYEEACRVRDAVLADLEALGALINWRKSVLNPGKCLRFLGMLVDSLSYRFFVPASKVQRLKELVSELMARDKVGEYPEATFRELASVVGKIMSMQVAVPAVRMLTHEAYRLIRPEGEWDDSVVLTKEVVEELLAVVDWVGGFNKVGNPIRRFKGMTELVVTVDAGTGFGWRLEGKERSEELTEGARAVAREWVDPNEREMWQCWKELLAVERCLEEELQQLGGAYLLVRVDAKTSEAYLNKGKGSSEFLTAVMKRIFNLCLKGGVSLKAEHIAGTRMIATGVDSMSRMAEFAVAPRLFRALNKAVGFGVTEGCAGYTLDLFAAKKSAKCKRFCSRGGADGAVGDAMTFTVGPEENVWACPPLGLLPKAAMMLVERGIRATIVVPVWPNQPWFGFLREHAVRHRELKWHEDSPVMLDLADRKHVHPHAADKWDFVAFALGEGKQGVSQWGSWPERRRRASVGKAERKRSNPELWQPEKRRRSLRQARQRREKAAPSFRKAKILSLCHGIGVASLCWQRLGTPVEVVAVELDPDCRMLTGLRFPGEDQSCWDVRDLLGRPMEWFRGVDLVVGGFPCQDVSSANKSGRGLQGSKSSLFFTIKELACRVRAGGGDFLLECTDFVGKHTEDFRLVGEALGVAPVILNAADVSAGFRRRAYWASFPVGVMELRDVRPEDIMEPGRRAKWAKLPTVMASGTRSWNTATAAVDANGKLGPLLTVEMERQMGLGDGFTDAPGLQEHTRHRMIGNAFQADVMQHILSSWIRHVEVTRDFDSTLGFPGEGPSAYAKLWGTPAVHRVVPEGGHKRKGTSSREAVQKQARRESTAGCYNALWGAARRVSTQSTQTGRAAGGTQAAEQGGLGRSKGTRRAQSVASTGGARGAAWKCSLPQGQVAQLGVQQSVVDRLGGASTWGDTRRTLLTTRQVGMEDLRTPKEATAYRAFVQALRRDLLLSARSDSTWRAYKGWVECFRAWLLVYGLPLEPAEGLWGPWMEVLLDSVAVLGLCYSMGTLDVYVSAVSAYMQDGDMQSPWTSREFKMEMEGHRRRKGLGKKKKPPVEPWHMARILRSTKKPSDLTHQQWRQAKVILNQGWQLFNRPQDFAELQVCDLVVLEDALEVTIRYAKNDPRGLTRSPKLAREGGRECAVTLWEEYAKAEGLKVHPKCTKVKGVPTRCQHCGPAFPAIWKHGGAQQHPVSPAMVSLRVRSLFMGLVETGDLTVEEAKEFSGKSMRCGGVSAAAAEAVRDGVLQGHGGWLQRQSLRHYDLMRDSEQCLVSSRLTRAVQRA